MNAKPFTHVAAQVLRVLLTAVLLLGLGPAAGVASPGKKALARTEHEGVGVK